MAKTATAEQRARQRTRQWRTELAAQQAEQDRRISGALAAVLSAGERVSAAGDALARAQAAYGQAVEAAAAETAAAVRALKAEGLSTEQIAELAGLAVADVRRAVKVDAAAASPSAGAAQASTDAA